MISEVVPDKLSPSGDYWVVTQSTSRYNPQPIGDHDPEDPEIELFSTKSKAKKRFAVLKQGLNTPDTYADDYDTDESEALPLDDDMDIDWKHVRYNKIELIPTAANLSDMVKGALN